MIGTGPDKIYIDKNEKQNFIFIELKPNKT